MICFALNQPAPFIGGLGMARILYVEDNEDNVYMLHQRLAKEGHDVLVARDGVEGLRTANAELPDLIIMDLVLPELDGWEAARRLKADPKTKEIPIIALTACVMPGDENRAREAGCDDFDSKPVDFDRLLSKINELLVA